MSNITLSDYRRFSYNPERQVFCVDETEVPLAQYGRSVSRIKPIVRPEVYYEESALLLANKAWMVPLIQTPRMTQWHSTLEEDDRREDVENRITEIMNTALMGFREQTGEEGFDIGLRASLWRGDVDVSTLDGQMRIGIIAYGRATTAEERGLGYRELGGNNLNDLTGDSHKVAFMAGVGALAYICMTETA